MKRSQALTVTKRTIQSMGLVTKLLMQSSMETRNLVVQDLRQPPRSSPRQRQCVIRRLRRLMRPRCERHVRLISVRTIQHREQHISICDGTPTAPTTGRAAREDHRSKFGLSLALSITRIQLQASKVCLRTASISIRTVLSERASFRAICTTALAILLVSSCGLGAQQRSPNRKIACKTPENSATCYWMHGRLSSYNGTPSFRLWKIGAHRILGIYSGPGAEKRDELDNEHPEFPANVTRVFAPPTGQIFADFEICPLEPEVAGKMQAACIESAKNVVTE